jgi:TatD DNase family protein
MFIDSHCHLNFDCFKKDQTSLIKALAEQHINHVIIPGTDAKRWPEIAQLVEGNRTLYYALGLHPHFLNDFKDEHLGILKQQLSFAMTSEKNRCVALGEIGLDKLITTDFALQEKVFVAQLHMAEYFQLPVILHVVKTQSRTLALLKQVKFSFGGIYHAFSGSEEIANEFIKLGFKLGIGGVITYPTAKKTQATLSKLPLSSFVLETDAPDMPIYQQKEQYNSPLNIKVIFAALCKLRKEPQQVVMDQIYENTKSIFSIIDD